MTRAALSSPSKFFGVAEASQALSAPAPENAPGAGRQALRPGMNLSPGKRPKPRWHYTLSEEQKQTLFGWFTEGKGLIYLRAQERVLQEWGIEMSCGQLISFWRSYCAPRLLRRPAEILQRQKETP